jgi:hypothetical protein
LNTNADLLVHWYQGGIKRDGDNTCINQLAQPEKIMFWYSPFTLDDEGIPYARDFTLYFLQSNLQQAHLQKQGFYVTLQTWGTKNRLTGNYEGYMYPTSAEITAETMLSLAHGAKGIFYETYYSYRSSDPMLVEALVDTMINGVFTPRENWYKVQELISRLKGKLGNTLITLDYTNDFIMLRQNVHESTPSVVSLEYLTLHGY